MKLNESFAREMNAVFSVVNADPAAAETLGGFGRGPATDETVEH